MHNIVINIAQLQEKIDKFFNEYRDNQDFSKLIENFENTIKEITSIQDVFILSVDSSKKELIIWSQKKHIFIENMEDNISIILDSYYRKKLHFVGNLTTSFIYNRELDQLVEYQLKDILVYPILNNEGEVEYIIWLAHPKKSQENFSPIDFENMENFIHSIQNITISKKALNTARAFEDTEKNDEKSLNILVVDDNTIILKFFSTVLHKHGFNVEIALNGIKALAIYEEAIDNIDVIFMDEIMYGGMYGHQVIEKIRAIQVCSKKQHIPIIAVTSDSSKDTRQLLLKSGCDIVLYKPINSKDIINVINKIKQT